MAKLNDLIVNGVTRHLGDSYFADIKSGTFNGNTILHTGEQDLTDAEKTQVKQNLGITDNSENLPNYVLDPSNYVTIPGTEYQALHIESLDEKFTITVPQNEDSNIIFYPYSGILSSQYEGDFAAFIAETEEAGQKYKVLYIASKINFDYYFIYAVTYEQYANSQYYLEYSSDMVDNSTDTAGIGIVSSWLQLHVINPCSTIRIYNNDNTVNCILSIGQEIIHRIKNPVKILNLRNQDEESICAENIIEFTTDDSESCQINLPYSFTHTSGFDNLEKDTQYVLVVKGNIATIQKVQG